MNKDTAFLFEKELKEIGNMVASWRDDNAKRDMLDVKAFKTEADSQAHGLLETLIKKYFPQDSIISEEDNEQYIERPQRYWLIDPIDGTASWYNGFAGFVTQVALVENGFPVYGAIYAPVLGKLWTGCKGGGAYLNGSLLVKPKPSEKLRLVDNYPEPQRIAKVIYESGLVSEYLESGSLGLKCCLVIDGSADLFVKDVIYRDWDIAPAYVLANELGVQICDFNGEAFCIDANHEKKGGLICAANRSLVDKVREITENS